MRQRRAVHAVMAALLCGLVLLAVHPASRFYPACPVYANFHLLCPGCGATRALSALLRGDFAAAWRMNALFVCALPLLLGYAVRAYRLRSFAMPPLVAWGSLGVAMVFGVVRNV